MERVNGTAFNGVNLTINFFKQKGNLKMNNQVLECKHCNGTGLCKQSIVKSRYEPYAEYDVDGEVAISGSHSYYRSVCEICGSTQELKDERDSRLVCKVCNGKGYLLVSDLKQVKKDSELSTK